MLTSMTAGGAGGVSARGCYDAIRREACQGSSSSGASSSSSSTSISTIISTSTSTSGYDMTWGFYDAI